MAESAVLESLAEEEAPRPLVPSARELRLGVDEDRGWEPMAAPPATAPPPALTDRLREYLLQLNPWHVAGGSAVSPLVLMGLASLLGTGDYQAIFVLIPQMRPSFGYDLAFLSVFNGVLSAVQTLVTPVVGWVADRTKRVRLVVVGSLVLHSGSILMGSSTSAGALLGARTVQAAGATIQGPALFPLLADYYPPDRRGRVFAFIMQSGTLGGIIMAPVIGVLADRWGWHAAVLTLGVVALSFTGLYLFLREPVRGEQDRLAAGADIADAQVPQAPVGWTESWRAVSSINTVRRLWWAQPFLSVAGFTSLVLPIYLTVVFHVSATGLGFIVAAEGATGLVGQAITGPLVDRLLAERPAAVPKLVGAIAVLKAVAVTGAALAPNLAVGILFACLSSAFLTLITPSYSPPILGLMSLVIPARVRGFGIQSLAPWTLLGLPIITVGASYFQSAGLSPRWQMLPFIPFYLVAAGILVAGGLTVDRDIRTALAVSRADEEARRSRSLGKGKLLVCRGLEVVYDGAQVLFGVDLDVEEGEILALLGTNGAGKSTVLRAISGVQEASAGAVFYDGSDITHVPPHLNARGGVVMLPGGRAIFPSLTVRENIRAAVEKSEQDDRLEEVLALFPALRERLDTVAGELSGGEQQMVALGQALLMRPRLLMIDELTLGLAPQVVDQLLAVLRRINAEGTTLILVEQSVNVALTVAGRAVFLDRGRVMFEGAPSDLLTRGDLVRSTFLGQSRRARSLGGQRGAPGAADEVEELLRLEDVTLDYGGVRALDHVSMQVSSHEVVGVIGPNGAGKTTLFDVISGFTTQTAGSVTLFGAPADGQSTDARARAGLIRSFQNVRLFGALTVRENVAIALERHLQNRSALAAAFRLPPARSSEHRVNRRVDNLIDSLGLRRYAETFVNELSTGSRRIVDLACLLAADPRLLLLDEPSSGLAQSESEELGPLVGRIAAETGCSIVIIEHDLPLVSSISSRMLCLDRGRVIATGSPSEVMSHPDVVTAYLGASAEALHRSGLATAGPSPATTAGATT